MQDEMTIARIIKVLSTADDNCDTCFFALLDQFIKELDLELDCSLTEFWHHWAPSVDGPAWVAKSLEEYEAILLRRGAVVDITRMTVTDA